MSSARDQPTSPATRCFTAVYAGDFDTCRAILADMSEDQMAHITAAAANLIDLARAIDRGRSYAEWDLPDPDAP